MEEKALQKKCNRIITDSTPLGEPLNPDSCNVFAITSLFLSDEEKSELKDRYKSGKEGYGSFKKYLKTLIWKHFEPAREKRAYYLSHRDEVFDILDMGAKRAKAIASVKMEMVKDAVGIIY